MHPSLGGTEEILQLLDEHHTPFGWCLLENIEVLNRALVWQIDNIFQASERVPFYHRGVFIIERLYKNLGFLCRAPLQKMV